MRLPKILLVSLTILCLALPALAASDLRPLPAPDKSGGKPLMQALAERQTNRAIRLDALDDQTLGDLLWAAWGVNRPDGRRTAPTAMNSQKLWLYAAMADGVWEYLPGEHALRRVSSAALGAPFADAPVILLYAVPADDGAGKLHAGSVYQNAGLYCASAGLANTVRTSTVGDPGRFAGFLPQGRSIVAAQSVGWPK